MCSWDATAIAWLSSLSQEVGGLVPAGVAFRLCIGTPLRQVQQGLLALPSICKCVSAPAFVFCSNLGHLATLASCFGASVQINYSDIYPKDLSSVYGQSWNAGGFWFPPPPSKVIVAFEEVNLNCDYHRKVGLGDLLKVSYNSNHSMITITQISLFLH